MAIFYLERTITIKFTVRDINMPRLRALFQWNRPNWIGITGLCVFLCCAGCALAVHIGDMAAAPPINVQETDLMGVWKATYRPQEIYDCCKTKDAKDVITETLALKADNTYEQRIEKGGSLLYCIEGRRWWIERVASNSVWLHLDGGRFYPLEIWHLCLCDSFQRDNATPPASCEMEYQPIGITGMMDRSYHQVAFDISKEVVLSLYRPLFSKEVFLEYYVGDPDAPREIRFYRLDNTRGSEK